MEGAPEPFENESPQFEANKDNEDLFDKRFVFGKGFSPEVPKKKKRAGRRSPVKKQLSARERWEESARRCVAAEAEEKQESEA